MQSILTCLSSSVRHATHVGHRVANGLRRLCGHSDIHPNEYVAQPQVRPQDAQPAAPEGMTASPSIYRGSQQQLPSPGGAVMLQGAAGVHQVATLRVPTRRADDHPPRPALDGLPAELIHHVLDALPNGPQSRVTSLALTSRRLFARVGERTRPRAKASRLMAQAYRIGRRAGSEGLDTYPATQRLGDFRGVLRQALTHVPDTPSDVCLRGRDVGDVLLALAQQIDALDAGIPHASLALLSALPGLDAGMHAGLHREQRELDEARSDILVQLASSHHGQQRFSDGQRRACFTRLCDVMKSIKTPAVKQAVAIQLVALDWCDWTPQHVATAGPPPLLRWLQDHQHDLGLKPLLSAVRAIAIQVFQHCLDGEDAVHYEGFRALVVGLESDSAKAAVIITLCRQIDPRSRRAVAGDDVLELLAGAARTIADPVLCQSATHAALGFPTTLPQHGG